METIDVIRRAVAHQAAEPAIAGIAAAIALVAFRARRTAGAAPAAVIERREP